MFIQSPSVAGNVSYAIVGDTSWSAADRVSAESVRDALELDRSSGVLVTRRPLDAERTATYRFRAVGVDAGAASARSSTVAVVVVVGDVNDNRPRFVFPSSPLADVVHVAPGGVARGRTVAAVSATDPDVGPAASFPLSYALSDDLGCFAVDRASGTVTVVDERPLVGRPDGWTLSLTVTATDAGGLETAATLYVVVNSSASTDAAAISGGWEALAAGSWRVVLAVVSIVAGCGVVVVGLVVVVAAVLGRRRRSTLKRRSRRRYNCRAAACLRLQQDAAAAAGPGHLPPVNAWSATDPAQTSLLLDTSGEVRNGQAVVKCYSNDDSVSGSRLDAPSSVLERSSNCKTEV